MPDNPTIDYALPRTPPGGMLNKIKGLAMKAGRRGFWPLADQGIVSIGNFAMSIVVGRSVSKPEFGIFGYALEMMLLVNSIQNALVNYPLTIKAASADAKRLGQLASIACLLGLMLIIPFSLFTTGVAAVLASKFNIVIPDTSSSTVVLVGSVALLMVFWQMHETLRRGLMAHLRHGDALYGDAITYLSIGAILYAYARGNPLTLPKVFGVMTFCYLAGIFFHAARIGVARFDRSEFFPLVRQFLSRGGWPVLTALSSLLVSITNFALGKFAGMSTAGQFYATGVLVRPINPLIISMSGLIVPAAARAYESGGVATARRVAAKYAMLGGALVGPYLLWLFIFPEMALRLFYGKDTFYLSDPHAITATRIFVIGNIFIYLATVASATLDGIHHTRQSFYAAILGSGSQIFISLPITIIFGLLGRLWGGTLGSGLQFVTAIYFLFRARNKVDEDPVNTEMRGFDVLLNTPQDGGPVLPPEAKK